MRDLIGRTLGHYVIVEKIGEGGMGEVYRAHDERLDRDVAIKVLPEKVAGVQGRLERFEREAKLLASLNHPNIATLHGLEKEDGHRFLVMELVEGESLAGVISRGPIPIDDALPIALQIAEALEAAHEQGIIHRDLKPANVMVNPDGGVKVLDFGLAKAFDPEGSGSQSPELISESPTLTADLTRGGVLLGTAAYMSPEQAGGKAVDKRADIWAFGCVVFEMLTGTRTFPGATSTEILAGIIKEEPDWDELPASTPPYVRRLLQRCLTKKPRNRIHDIADVRIELQSPYTDGVDRLVPEETEPVRRGWSFWRPWILALVAIGIAWVLLFFHYRQPAQKVASRFLIDVEPETSLGWTHPGPRPPRTGDRRLRVTALALSSDGKDLVFVAGGDTGSRLYLRAIGDLRAEPIAGTEGAESPFFSPNGEWMGFWEGGKIKKVRTSGGPVVPICDVPQVPIGVSWGADGVIVYGQRHGGVMRVSAEGSVPEEITSLAAGETSHRHPTVLSDGETLLFSSIGAGDWGDWDDTRIVAQSLKTGDRKTLLENGTDARLAPSGHLVFVRLGTLMAVPFDSRQSLVTGNAVVVLGSVRQSVNAANLSLNTFSGQFSFSNTGSLVHVPGGVWPDREYSLVWVDRSGQTEPLALEPGPYWNPSLSPDGERVAVDRWSFDEEDVWLFEINRAVLSRLTYEEHGASWALWTPDGSRITFSQTVTGKGSINWTSADGSGQVVPLISGESGLCIPSSWSPDGQILAFVKSEAGNADIWTLRLHGESEPFIASESYEGWPSFSPDGRWLAYASNGSGRHEVYVTPYPGPGPKFQVSTNGGSSPAWSSDGSELFYMGVASSEKPGSVWVADVTTKPRVSFGKARVLFEGNFPSTHPVGSYSVSSDGRRFLMREKGPQRSEPVTHINLTLNWFEELKRLAPTD